MVCLQSNFEMLSVQFLFTQARLFGFFDSSSDQDQAFLNLELPPNKYTRLKEVWLENYKLNGHPYPYNEIMKVTTNGFPNEVYKSQKGFVLCFLGYTMV